MSLAELPIRTRRASSASRHRAPARDTVRIERATLQYAWVVPIMAGVVALLVAVAGIAWVGSAVGTALLLLFLVFFVRHLAFAIAAFCAGRWDLDHDDALVVRPDHELPTVSVMVACKNEETVLPALLRALGALDYPRDRMQWIIVDDGSTDTTGAILDAAAAETPWLLAVHRPAGRRGGKSGALNDGLAAATGEIVVVFDADHRPRPDVVRRLVRHFDDGAVGAAQGRCVISNGGDSMLAELVALDYAGGYLINEYGRQAVFQLPAYGGANCAVRASLLRSLGGWNEASVTEDTDLTMRVVLSGHRVRYDINAVDEEEGVVTLRRYWRQRYRWARGHQQCWRDYRTAVWRSHRLSLLEKIETTMFLYGFHLPVVSSLGLVVMVLWGLGITTPAAASLLFVYTTLLFLGPLVEIGGGLIISGADRKSAFNMIWFLPMFFASMAVCMAAWVDGVLGRPYAWVKTRRRAELELQGQAVRPVAAVPVLAGAAGGGR